MKSLIVLTVVAIASAQYYGPQKHHVGYYEEEHYAPPHYSFEYSVHDEHTGDIKSQKETREGDVVRGFYTLKEADGTIREVHYTADKHNGFNAEVKKIGTPVYYKPAPHYNKPASHYYKPSYKYY